MVVGVPSLVDVTLFTTTFVAPSANEIDKIANGVINGGILLSIQKTSLTKIW
ncbi:hypothetical protein FC85_GL000280 [Lentilactobacillus diolivorans DSM 14421]|uniref:Uncharacterized protein n=1 Tax=Lentilactobacillus diolivorans DSM 14421 TaxID=1423739 RepID=A0A0R1SKQ2_9LACO|nr:hypothetical protein FC85_GL000280 [Lentilactobacillus diolivorans DSM 14421]